jgi:hypothetical protein
VRNGVKVLKDVQYAQRSAGVARKEKGGEGRDRSVEHEVGK